MKFHDPWAFILIALIPLLIFFAKKRRSSSSILFSSSELIKAVKPSFKLRLSNNIILFRGLALVLFFFALARPQYVIEETKTYTEGVDIVLALDTSTSMLAEDFRIGGRQYNRFDVVRDVVKDFIVKRKDDRLGLIAFAAKPYTVCPLTLDHQWLLENLDRVKVGMIEDATAIGSAIASSLNRLKDTKAKSKVIILLTDGINNAGKITPLTAAEASKALKMKIYTIGVGTKGLVPYPMRDHFGRKVYQNIRIDIDEATLQKVASITDGKYYRATDAESLRRIYAEIDRLEKVKIEHAGFREVKELFWYFLIPALGLLLFEVVLANTVLARIP